MSFNNASLPIQIFIDSYGFTDRTYNVIDFVLRTSMANTKVSMEPPQFLNAPGKKRTVRMNYWPINCDLTGSCSTGLCDDGTALEPSQRDFDITRCTASPKIKVNFDDIRKTDNGNWDFSGVALNGLASIMPQFRQTIANDWLTYLFTLKGVHPNGNASERISVTNPATGIVNPIGRIQIQTEYEDAGFGRDPFILGDKEVKYWKEMVTIGGLNAQGQYINQVDTANAWYDQGLLQSIGGDLIQGGWILTIDPQMFKMVSYVSNAGIFRTDLSSITDMDKLFKSSNGEGFILGTLIDPVTKLVFDLYINFIKCDAVTGLPVWTIQLKHVWDMFVMPDVSCVGEGVNGIMAWRTCPLVIAVCPTGDSPSPAVTPTTYSWTPGAIYTNLNVATSTIGSITVGQSHPVAIANITALASFLNDVTGQQYGFYVSGSTIRYSGYTALTGTLNGGQVTVTFA